MTIDRIIRSKRKTVALIVEPDGTLTVRAPERLSKRMIDALVREREDWIREKQVMVRGEYLQNQNIYRQAGSKVAHSAQHSGRRSSACT